MAEFLRDQFIKNVDITENSLRQLSRVFEERLETLKQKLNEGKPTDQHDPHVAFLTYIIRFDQKGYRLWDIEEVIRNFRQAQTVERVIFTLESGEALSSNRRLGQYLELGLDTFDENKSALICSSSERDWTDASFSEVRTVLERCKNRSQFLRSRWADLALQLTGIAFGFVLSLWLAIKNSTVIRVESAFLMVFLFTLLVWSNLWTHIYGIVSYKLGRLFPSVSFERDKSPRWLVQTIVGAVVVTAMFWALGKIATWVAEAVSPHIAL